MGCGCGKKAGAQSAPGWTVDLTGTSKTHGDGTTIKVFATVGEANIAVAKLGLGGKVRPRPAKPGDTA